MTPGELVLSVERQWGKPFKPDQRATYVRKLGRFNPIQLEQIFDKLLEDCSYVPKVSNIFDAARDLGFLQQSRERKTLGSGDCPTCEGIGVRYITRERRMSDGVVFKPGGAVVRCECRRLAPEAAPERPPSSTPLIAKTKNRAQDGHSDV